MGITCVQHSTVQAHENGKEEDICNKNVCKHINLIDYVKYQRQETRKFTMINNIVMW